MSTQTSDDLKDLPAPARMAASLERANQLDPAVSTMEQVMGGLRASSLGSVLRGGWLGHALHPVLTDVPLGLWTATSLLDLAGGAQARPAAQRLVGFGVAAAAPTALSGWAEWVRADTASKRVGIVHAVVNATAVGLYAGSWLARRSGRHRAGAALALAGGGVAGVGGYLGGHLTTVLGVGTRHPAFVGGEAASDVERGSVSMGLRNHEADHTGTTKSGQGLPSQPGGPLEGSEAAGAAAGDQNAMRHERSLERERDTDVTTALAADHGRLVSRIQDLSTTPEEQREEALQGLLRAIAAHEAVEQVLMHPRLEGTDQAGVAMRRRDEEGLIAQQLDRLGEIEVGSQPFQMQFNLFEEAYRRHCEAEVDDELPALVERLSEEEAELLVRVLGDTESAALAWQGTYSEMVAAAVHDVRVRAAR